MAAEPPAPGDPKPSPSARRVSEAEGEASAEHAQAAVPIESPAPAPAQHVEPEAQPEHAQHEHAQHEHAQPEPTAPSELRPWRVIRSTLLGLLKLGAMLLPELAAGVLGAMVGLALGVYVGVSWTGDLLSSPGPWGRAGVLALIVPALTALGPPILFTLAGALLPPPLVLTLHALVTIPVSLVRWRDRHLAIFAAALAMWLPALFLSLRHGIGAALVIALILSPLTAPFGFTVGAAWVAARGTLRGRSFAAFWRDADASMAVAALSVSVYAWLVTWLGCALLCLLPTVPVALAVGIALSIRLVQAGRSTTLAIAVGLVDLAHVLGLVVLAILALAAER
jgi:hypothetical protein